MSIVFIYFKKRPLSLYRSKLVDTLLFSENRQSKSRRSTLDVTHTISSWREAGEALMQALVNVIGLGKGSER